MREIEETIEKIKRIAKQYHSGTIVLCQESIGLLQSALAESVCPICEGKCVEPDENNEYPETSTNKPCLSCGGGGTMTAHDKVLIGKLTVALATEANKNIDLQKQITDLQAKDVCPECRGNIFKQIKEGNCPACRGKFTYKAWAEHIIEHQGHLIGALEWANKQFAESEKKMKQQIADLQTKLAESEQKRVRLFEEDNKIIADLLDFIKNEIEHNKAFIDLTDEAEKLNMKNFILRAEAAISAAKKRK